MSPVESKEELGERINLLRQDYDKLNKQKKNSIKIQDRKECISLYWENSFQSALEKINVALQKNLESHHKEASLKVSNHIEVNFKNAQNAENWIRQGLVQNNGQCCQFCGQTLGIEALQLLDLYRKSFDTVYEEYDKHIKQELNDSKSLLVQERINALRIAIESNNAALKMLS